MSASQAEKAILRVTAKRARASMSKREREQASLVICDSVRRDRNFQRATNIAVYMPTEREVSCWPLIERAWSMKKRIFAPILKKKRTLHFCELRPNSDLQRNRYAIAEPIRGHIVPARQLDMVITPLLAFDESGTRLGMGGGYYDRTFSFLRQRDRYRKPKLFGLGFDCQRLAKIPASPWDIRLFQIHTESGPVIEPANQ